MSNVTLTIGGRPYTVSAADGEEAHIEMLGRMVAERAARGGGGPGQSEPRMLLFAALMLADELHELHRQMPPPQDTAEQPAAPEPTAEVIARIETLAARVEALAAHLSEA
ncbi:cell division protein ZapA [Novosphingobium sp. PASSN1]|uniref:cell division protein ZapA n=1 Tax=Novosphingobium sp. PASSN1 TaxID=2015561 RepID=UPI000BD3319E|nr:cell division protein ZapA [Novosphingobium sp. PASSN1]OYU35297.1 MAG: cell division protein ZapA [Novosphingobium sp. PASSN1]